MQGTFSDTGSTDRAQHTHHSCSTKDKPCEIPNSLRLFVLSVGLILDFMAAERLL